MIRTKMRQGFAGGFEVGSGSSGGLRMAWCNAFRNDSTCDFRRLVAGTQLIRHSSGELHGRFHAASVLGNSCGFSEPHKKYDPKLVSAAMFGME